MSNSLKAEKAKLRPRGRSLIEHLWAVYYLALQALDTVGTYCAGARLVHAGELDAGQLPTGVTADDVVEWADIPSIRAVAEEIKVREENTAHGYTEEMRAAAIARGCTDEPIEHIQLDGFDKLDRYMHAVRLVTGGELSPRHRNIEAAIRPVARQQFGGLYTLFGWFATWRDLGITNWLYADQLETARDFEHHGYRTLTRSHAVPADILSAWYRQGRKLLLIEEEYGYRYWQVLVDDEGLERLKKRWCSMRNLSCAVPVQLVFPGAIQVPWNDLPEDPDIRVHLHESDDSAFGTADMGDAFIPDAGGDDYADFVIDGVTYPWEALWQLSRGIPILG